MSVIDIAEAVMGKRQRTNSNATMNYGSASFCPVAGTEGSLTVLGQQFESKKKIVIGKKKTKLAKMIRQWIASQNAVIGRWQALSRYNAVPSSLRLDQTVLYTADQINLPMYAFNLTALCLNRILPVAGTGALVNAVSFPMYRLYKNTPAAGAETYGWAAVTANHGDKLGTGSPTGWQIEWDNINGSAPIQVNKYEVEWVDVKTVFQGCQRPTKVHMAIAKMPKGPLRQYFDGAVQTFDVDDANDLVDQTAFWDHFWARKISNPIRSSRRPDHYLNGPTMQVLKHESFVIGQDTNINNDSVPLQATVNRFMQIDELRKIDNERFSTLQTRQIVEDQVGQPGSAFGYVGVNATDTTISATNGIFGDRSQDKWLVIYADVYDQFKYNTDTTGSYPDGVTVSYMYAPSFDINVRAKFVYNT